VLFCVKRPFRRVPRKAHDLFVLSNVVSVEFVEPDYRHTNHRGADISAAKAVKTNAGGNRTRNSPKAAASESVTLKLRLPMR
jgi:hypothetical protein